MDTEYKQRLAWLAGVIDGEGSLSMFWRDYHYVVKSGKSIGRKVHHTGYEVKLQIDNTNPLLIESATDILNEILKDAPTKKAASAWLHKRKTISGLTVWKIIVSGRTRLSVILPAIIPFLVGKKREAGLILHWFDTTKPFQRGEADRFCKYVDQMKAWHANPNSLSVEANMLDFLNDGKKIESELHSKGAEGKP